jgi:hypothetical protein
MLQHCQHNPLWQIKLNQYFYALGIDPSNNEVYIADAKDFNQKGTSIHL